MFLDAGDAVHGTLFAQFSSGESMIELMGMVGVDAMTCGNHEFDYGAVQLKELETQAAAAGFPIMGANVTKTDSGLPFFGVNVKEFDVAGRKVIVFGVTTPETKYKAHPNYTKGVSFGAGDSEQDLDAFAAKIQAVIDGLPPAEVVIMMGHLGVDMSSPIRTTTLLPKLKGLDLVIDGHSHTADYKMKIKDKEDKEVLVVQAGKYFEQIGRILVEFDAGEIRFTPEHITFKDVRGLEGDPAILAKIKAFNDANAAELGKVIGKTATKLVQSGDFRGKENVQLVRVQETNLGNLVADSLRKATGADVALTNGGGIRANIEPGEITFGDAVSVLPFGNLITVIRVTGQQIVDALKHGAGGYPAPMGGFPQVSGLTFVIETEGLGDKEAFKGIADVKVGGTPIDLKKTYTLATNDFMAVGGDNYTMFEGAEQVLLHGLMLEAFIDEIKALTKAAGAEGFTYGTDGRIKVRNLSEVEPAVPTGETAVYLVSGVLFFAVAALLLLTSRRKVEES